MFAWSRAVATSIEACLSSATRSGYLKAADAILDGEIVCLDAEGRSQFNHLVYRRGEPCCYVFDLLWLNGRDLRKKPLIQRKSMLREIVPAQPSRLLYSDHIHEQGGKLFGLVCQRDLEGIVAKWAHGLYLCDGRHWVKVKNPAQPDRRAG